MAAAAETAETPARSFLPLLLKQALTEPMEAMVELEPQQAQFP
jgi:hypothetical protein